MRRPGILVFVAGALASTAAFAACSLVVDTAGLSDGNPTSPTGETGTLPETGASDGTVATDSPSGDGTAPDGGFDCDGGTRITSFASFTPSGPVTIQGSTITATVPSSAVGQEISAVARGDFQSISRRLLVTYDLVLTRSEIVYFEPGCGIYLQNDAQETILRQTFAANHESFSGYLNIQFLDGGEDSRQAQFGTLPVGESTRHVEALMTMSGKTVTANVNVDGTPQSDVLLLPDVPGRFFVRCGIAYGNQTSPGPATTTVKIQNLAISLCP